MKRKKIYYFINEKLWKSAKRKFRENSNNENKINENENERKITRKKGWKWRKGEKKREKNAEFLTCFFCQSQNISPVPAEVLTKIS